MRAVKSVLVMAGSLKRQNPDKPEDVVLIRALRDSNLPKFLVDDAGLFQVSTASTYIYSHLLRNKQVMVWQNIHGKGARPSYNAEHLW